MVLYRLLLHRFLRRPATVHFPYAAVNHHPQFPANPLLAPHRNFAFSSAEEAAAERRRRKRQLRIEPPLHALQRNNHPPPRRDPNAPRVPDTTSSLIGPRLSLHNSVQSLIRAGDLDAASAVARHSVTSRPRPTVFTCNAVIAAMYRAKRYSEAISLFNFFFNESNIVPNVVSYNNLINTHCDQGSVDTALQLYRQIMETAPFSPSAVTYRHLTKGLIDAGRIQEAVDLLREMLNKGHGADSMVYNNLISGFLNLENLDKANEFFDELKDRCLVYDGVVNATFMEWFFNKGREKEAMESYKSLLDRQFKMLPATCNTLLEVLLKHGKKEEAWSLFHQMLDNHTPPNFQAVNSDAYNIMVNECFQLGLISKALDTFRKVGTKPGAKPFAMDVAGFNNLIARLCEVGMLSEAEQLFGELSSKSLTPDVTTFRTLIDAFLKVERIDDALRFFRKMVDAGLRVVASFCNRVFESLIDNGKAVNCSQLLTKMGEKDPKPDSSCYDVVIKGLCKETELDTSLGLLEQMMRYGIVVSPSLRELVTEEFNKVGRGGEVQKVLTMDKQRFVPNYPPSRNNRPFPPSPYQRPHVQETRQGGNEGLWGPQLGRQATQLSPEHHSVARNGVTPPRGPPQMNRQAVPTPPGSYYASTEPSRSPPGSYYASTEPLRSPPGSYYAPPEPSMSTPESYYASPESPRPSPGSYYASPESSRSSYMSGGVAAPQMERQASPSPPGPPSMDRNAAPAQWGSLGKERQTMFSAPGHHHMDGNVAHPRQGTLGKERQTIPSPPGTYHMDRNAAPAQWGHSGMGRQTMPSSPGPYHTNGNVAPPQSEWPHRTHHMDGNAASPTWGRPEVERQTMSWTQGSHPIDGNVAPPHRGPPQMDRRGASTQPGRPNQVFNAEPSYQMEREDSRPSFPYVARR